MKKCIIAAACGTFLTVQLLAVPGCGQLQRLDRLLSPQNFEAHDDFVTWEEVKHAVGYVVEFQNKETETAEPRFALPDGLAAGGYTIQVMAIGDYETFDDSEWTFFAFTLERSADEDGDDEPIVKQDYDSMGLLYTLLPDGSGYEVGSGKADLTGTVTIPETFHGLPVKRIADYGFSLNTWRKDPFVGIGCNITTTDLILPSSLEEIGADGLSCLTRVEEFVLPESVKVIGRGAFYGCTHLKRINLPDGIKEIPGWCFRDCDLDEIEIPNSVEKIGYGAFEGSREDTSHYADIYGFPDISKGMQSLKKIVIPDSVKIIEREAFRGCSNLKEITLSDNLTWLGEMSFYGTAWLDSCAEGPVLLGDVFYGYIGHPVSITIPQTAKKIAGGAMDAREYDEAAYETLEEITIPDGVKLIGEYIFCGCRNLTSVRLPRDLTEIPADCFTSCTLLEEIELPQGVKAIGDGAFYNCTALKEIDLPDGLEKIGIAPFAECTFTQIVLPRSLKELGRWSSPRTSSIQAIYYEGTAVKWAALAAQNNLFDESGSPREDPFGEAVIYFFTETPPQNGGNYWRYVDGKPTVW